MGDGLSRQRQAFAARFEPDGDGYLFRTHRHAPGVAVDAAERDRLVQSYSRRIGWTSWIAAILILPALAAMSWALARMGGSLPTWAFFTPIAPCLLIYLVPVYWLWFAPDRALRGRPARANASERV